MKSVSISITITVYAYQFSFLYAIIRHKTEGIKHGLVSGYLIISYNYDNYDIDNIVVLWHKLLTNPTIKKGDLFRERIRHNGY